MLNSKKKKKKVLSLLCVRSTEAEMFCIGAYGIYKWSDQLLVDVNPTENRIQGSGNKPTAHRHGPLIFEGSLDEDVAEMAWNEKKKMATY